MKKLHVGVLFGGKSVEHEVSLQSAKNIIEALNPENYDVTLIGIDKAGGWYLNEQSHFLLNADNPTLIQLTQGRDRLALIPGEDRNQLVTREQGKALGPLDVVFPVLHGPLGEDGTVQGLLRLADVPFVGAGVLGSAVGMDKEVAKRLLRDAGLPIARFLTFNAQAARTASFDQAVTTVGLPMFVKPANLGSSVGIRKVHNAVGIRKVHNAAEFLPAITDAFQYDRKILIEEFIEGREIECAVIGNADPIASLPGEIVPQHEFYSYEAKYIDEHGALLEIPARLPQPVIARVQALAVEAFRVLCCEGMARVDFLLRGGDEAILNEINTIPGFTRISMFPKLWEVSGLSYAALLDRLIELAIERYAAEKRLKTSVEL
ncbi:MAG: D-alanine--D-alanine ligase [Candidatus Hydrogenedentes bacterium]|nr:D-alanine--D-alanine ligase [Candidatus Hydrogenedentota bacterium]